MGRYVLWGAIFALLSLVAGATSHSEDTSLETPPLVDLAQPATAALGANPPHDPTTPYDVGPASEAWPYEALSAVEQEAADHSRDASAWRGVHDVYNAGFAEQARRTSADVAQRLLGVQDLGDVGVVP